MTIARRVLPVDRRALHLYRQHFWKIVVVAAVVFAPLSLFSAAINHRADDLIDDGGSGLLLGGLTLVSTALVVFGYALCCGLLDKMVVGPEFGHPAESLGRSLRTLPYGRLVVLDLLTTVGIAVGVVLGVVPGIVFFTFVALAPPLLVSENRGVWSAMKRSARLVRHAFWLTFLVVTLPVLVEHEIFTAIELLFDLPLFTLWLAHLAASVFVLAVVVLCEITLAFSLVEDERGGGRYRPAQRARGDEERLMAERTRGVVMAVCGILVLTLNVIEAVDRGSSAWNLITIATGAFLLFYGFAVIARPPKA